MQNYFLKRHSTELRNFVWKLAWCTPTPLFHASNISAGMFLRCLLSEISSWSSLMLSLYLGSRKVYLSFSSAGFFSDAYSSSATSSDLSLLLLLLLFSSLRFLLRFRAFSSASARFRSVFDTDELRASRSLRWRTNSRASWLQASADWRKTMAGSIFCSLSFWTSSPSLIDLQMIVFIKTYNDLRNCKYFFWLYFYLYRYTIKNMDMACLKLYKFKWLSR